MNSNKITPLHYKSSLTSPTGFCLNHLTEDELERLKERAEKLKQRIKHERVNRPIDFEMVDETVQIIKRLYVDLAAFYDMQRVQKVPLKNVLIINDMISIAKGDEVVMPLSVRLSVTGGSNHDYPAVRPFSNNRFLWLSNALQNNFLNLINITLYVLGDNHES